jgi:hypothetical protein
MLGPLSFAGNRKEYPVTEIRKWNIVDAVCVAAAWNSISHVVICNYCITEGFDTEKYIN